MKTQALGGADSRADRHPAPVRFIGALEILTEQQIDLDSGKGTRAPEVKKLFRSLIEDLGSVFAPPRFGCGIKLARQGEYHIQHAKKRFITFALRISTPQTVMLVKRLMFIHE